MSIEAMKQVIELYDKHCYNNDYGGIEFSKKHGYKFIEAIEALRTAIQQAESDHARLPGVLKDHQIAAMVNSLRDIARQFHGHGSLRERIANVLVPALKAEAKTDEPVAWAPVPEFEDLYEVSSLGEIRSMVTWKVLAKNKMGAGYIKADLWKDGSRKQTSVHRVVASAFLGDLTGLEVNHINGDKTDNRVSNLELATRSENERHSRSKLKNLVKPVLARNLTTGNILEFESVEAAARFGFVPSSIYRCCYGICKKHRGYEFAFKNPSHADGKKATTHPALGVLDDVARDAERYRWLRKWKGQEHEPPFTVQHEFDGTIWGGDLDSAIDAAMTAAQAQKGQP